jgi:hypothetical protein
MHKPQIQELEKVTISQHEYRRVSLHIQNEGLAKVNQVEVYNT